MPTSTQTPAGSLPSGEQIYNTIMGQIEPDLLTNSGVVVDAPIAGESTEQYAQRMERYRKAFSLYEKAFEKFVANIREESKKSKLATRAATEQKLHNEEEAAADALLSKLTSA